MKSEKLLSIPHTTSADDCSVEVENLQTEFLKLDNLFNLRDDLPLVKELINDRFKQLHNRICELNSRKL